MLILYHIRTIKLEITCLFKKTILLLFLSLYVKACKLSDIVSI